MYVSRLKIKHDADGVFTDRSNEAAYFRRDSFLLPMIAAEDLLYVGRFKPFTCFYVEVKVANTDGDTLTAEYWNGTAWTALSIHSDDTNGFKNSGFIRFENPDDWDNCDVDSEDGYWVRFTPGADFAETTEISGIGIVFADDYDLAEEVSTVSRMLPEGETTFILKHVAARKRIVQRLRRDGHYKFPIYSPYQEDIDEWDLHNIEQVRVAAKFMALHLIYLEASDNPDDIHRVKAEKYQKEFDDAINVFYLSLDKNDDGIRDQTEASASVTGRLQRGDPQY